jgi:hypothetical protein
MAVEAQVYDIVKGANPTAHARICTSDDWETSNVETARVASGRIGRVRKGLLP